MSDVVHVVEIKDEMNVKSESEDPCVLKEKKDLPKTNRFQRGRKKDKNQEVDETEIGEFGETFKGFQRDLDKRYEKYERLVKLSRDVTFESKRVIFLLHRIVGESNKELTLHEAEEKLNLIETTQLRTIASELQGEDYYQFLRAFSPGLQEYVEAVTYLSYQTNGTVCDISEIQKRLIFEENLVLFLPQLEYMLGVADLSGELMRKCINSVGQGDLVEPLLVCGLMRDLYDGFTATSNLAGKEMWRKVTVLKQSLKKVENACYNLTVRRSEIPKNVELPKHVINMFLRPAEKNESESYEEN